MAAPDAKRTATNHQTSGAAENRADHRPGSAHGEMV